MWEYKTIVAMPLTVAMLNEDGMVGWEHYLSVGNIHYFKRFIKVSAGKDRK